MASSSVYDRSIIFCTSIQIESAKALTLMGRSLFLTTVTCHTENAEAHMTHSIYQKAHTTTHMENVEARTEDAISCEEVTEACMQIATFHTEITAAQMMPETARIKVVIARIEAARAHIEDAKVHTEIAIAHIAHVQTTQCMQRPP